MFRTLRSFLERMYFELLDLDQKSRIIRNHGQYLDSIRDEHMHLLIYSLNYPIKNSFAVVHFKKVNRAVVKIELLVRLEVADRISAQILTSLSLHPLNQKPNG